MSLSPARLLICAAIVALAVLAGFLAMQNSALRNEAAVLRSERELVEIAYKTAQTELQQRTVVAETMITQLGRQLRAQEDLSRLKIAALASQTSDTKEAQVIAVWDPGRQTGLLTAEKLPAISADQDYQIWIIDPAYKNPVNGGVFHVSADGKAALGFKPDQPVTPAAAFAISLEKKGGVPKAEGPMLMLGK